MLHPDYQYDPRLVTAMASMVDLGRLRPGAGLAHPRRHALAPAACRFGSTSPTARSRLVENLALGSKLSEFHTGYRAYSREALTSSLPLLANSDDFVFDNQVLAQAIAASLAIGEISCPTSYHGDASSIGFARSVTYGLGVVRTSATFVAWRLGIARPRIFDGAPEDFLR